MLRAVLGWIGIALLGACTYQTALLQPSSPGLPAVSFQSARLQSSSPAPGPTSAYREVLDRYCASCHVGMDPYGFALENFDAIGKWRTTEGQAPIDAAGVLPDGTRFEGPVGLRKMLLKNPEQFVQTVTKKLLTYALGRELDSDDDPAVEKIVREGAAGGYRWSSLIFGIIKSTPFQMRRSQL